MTNYLLVASLLLMQPLAAQTPAKATKSAAQAVVPARKLLPGTWQSVDDKNYLLVITDKQYIERYAGQPDEARGLRVLDQPCDEPNVRPTGGLYLQTSAADPANNTCYYLVSVTATRLQLSPVGGRGNTLTFKRVTQSASKRQGMP